MLKYDEPHHVGFLQLQYDNLVKKKLRVVFFNFFKKYTP